MSGAALTVAGLAGTFGFGFSTEPVVLTLEIASFFASFALPVAISVGILKYRLGGDAPDQEAWSELFQQPPFGLLTPMVMTTQRPMDALVYTPLSWADS